MGGEQVIQELKEQGEVPEEDRVAGFALGADYYVVKPFSARELVYRVIEAVCFEHGALTLDGHRYEVIKDGSVIGLTPTEFKVLFALASLPGIRLLNVCTACMLLSRS